MTLEHVAVALPSASWIVALCAVLRLHVPAIALFVVINFSLLN